LKHHDDFAEFITPRDEDALKYLLDVKTKPLTTASDPSFILEFHFSENPYFEDKLLSKTYHLQKNDAYGDIMFDRVEATEIKWKSEKNLTVKKVTKQQGGRRGGSRGKRGGKFPQPSKAVVVEEPCESFFNFFAPDAMFGVDEEVDEEDKETFLETDYEMGISVRDQIIPNAVLWFTGEMQEELEDHEEGEYDDDDGEENEDSDSEADEDFQPPPSTTAGEPAAQQECKQQ